MGAPEPNLDHPLVEIARRMLQPDPVERWRLDEAGATIIERALLSQKSDPDLAGGVLGLFHVATDLHRTHGADAAAGRLFAVLGKVGPQLFARGSAPEIEDLIERAGRSMEAGPRTLPLLHDTKPPEGTIPAHSLQFRGSDPRRRRR